MTHDLEMERTNEPAPPAGFAIADLWLLPLLLLALIFEKFSQHLSKLKGMRRTRPMPKDWKSFYPKLREAEWAIRMFLHEGARQLILGEELDLSTIGFDPEPPEAFQPPMPRSALAMHLRMEDIARFHADPERYVRRHAERIRRRGGDGFQNPNPANSAAASPESESGEFFARSNPANFPVALPVAVAIRGPP